MQKVLNNGFAELSENDMEEINGGGGAIAVATLSACLALGKLAFECGEKIGRFVYVTTH